MRTHTEASRVLREAGLNNKLVACEAGLSQARVGPKSSTAGQNYVSHVGSGRYRLSTTIKSAVERLAGTEVAASYESACNRAYAAKDRA